MTEALDLRGLSVPGWTGTYRLLLGRHETRAIRLERDVGASLLRAVAGVRNRGRPRVTVESVSVEGSPVTREVKDGRVVSQGLAPEQRGLGYVPAGPSLLPHLSIRENIVGDLRARGADTLLDELAGNLELNGALTLLPQDLLGPDEHLRVALARAAFGEPSVRIVHVDPVPVAADALPSLLERACVGSGPPPATLIVASQSAVCDAFEEVEVTPEVGLLRRGVS